MKDEFDFDRADEEFIEIYKRNFPDRIKMEQEIRSVVNVADFHEACVTSSIGSIVYPKNMNYEEAKESNNTWNIGYPLEWLGSKMVFGYNIGDLVQYENSQRFLIILSHVPFDDRYPGKLEEDENPHHFANLMDSSQYVLFEPTVIGIDSEERKIIPDINFNIDAFYTIDRLKKPRELDNYLLVGEFLYYMKILAEHGTDGEKIFNFGREISKQVPDIGLHEINPIVTKMYEEFIESEGITFI